MKNKFMTRAIELSIENVNLGGGPFEIILRSFSQLLGEIGTKCCANREKQGFYRFWYVFGCTAGAPHMQSVHAGAVETHFSVFGPLPQKASHWAPFWSHFGDNEYTFGTIGVDLGDQDEALQKG